MVIDNQNQEFTGKIKWYNKEKGFGIILEKNSQEEIFVHHSNIIDNNNKKYVILEENEDVKFQTIKMDNRICALRVSPVADRFQNEREFKKNNNQKFDNSNKKKHVRNTTNFSPSHEPSDMRIMVHLPGDKYTKEVTSRDVILVKNLFDSNENIYQKLKYEINNSGLKSEDLWKSWHGDTHFIADDHLRWKEQCPTFQNILTKIAKFFDMEIKATRLNFYSDSKEWKPFHHDAAAVKQDKAKTQNFTVAISFGLEREVAFEHAKSGTIISVPAEDGSVYAFCSDVNIIWKHGIRQMKDEEYSSDGRFSVIAWGWRKMIDI